jgi:hypothetical protein
MGEIEFGGVGARPMSDPKRKQAKSLRDIFSRQRRPVTRLNFPFPSFILNFTTSNVHKGRGLFLFYSVCRILRGANE